MIDRDGIERDRGQLWAEAIAQFKNGAKWWLETPELEELAVIEQLARLKKDAWQDLIERWLGKRKETSVGEVLKGALKIPPQEQTQTAFNRVAAVLTSLGFIKYRAGSDGARENRYRRL
jgi:putative DNA primase/helicase